MAVIEGVAVLRKTIQMRITYEQIFVTEERNNLPYGLIGPLPKRNLRF